MRRAGAIVSRLDAGRDAPAGLTRASLAVAARELSARDADLARLLAAHGPPPLWSRQAGFATLIRIILEQQVSLASARSIYLKIRDRLGGVTPARLAAAEESGLRALGLTRQKSAYCVAAARAVMEDGLDLAALIRRPDDEVRAALLRIKGVGPWSADIYLLMALRRPDVWPSGDLALVSAARRVKRLRGEVTARRWERLAEGWRPHRSTAARMLWQFYLAQREAGR